ncbi:MAG: beta-galactosidase [Candidatus Aureabacteria bacterium]|nr:beta-galactosidase [Candidatus Auribacterota bacterium]
MKNTVKYDKYSLIINGERKILIGGEVHYFRMPRGLWEDRVKKVKQAGCNLIATYIPWNFHEEEEGALNWEGDRDLPYFLKLCEKYGLYVILKPGPYICAEWDFGGFPHWLLAKNIRLRVADKEYLALVKKWYEEVAEIAKPHLFTQGGNVVLVQIENEYDHLLEEMPEITGSKETARKYLLKLLDIVRGTGIDVPAFTNEGSCILGTEIINTHTYYPNIPWIWMWEFNDFDRKMDDSLRLQPDKPVMMMELEAGWFAQFGKPLYEVEYEAVEAITKTLLAYGNSVINYYMFAGGTTFPFWISKGDYGGIGTCTTFDFGASPIREWGELHRKYHLIRNWAYFLESFPDVITAGTIDRDGARFVSGSENIAVLHKKASEQREDFKFSYENVRTILRRGTDRSVLLIRNLEDVPREFAVEFYSGQLKGKIKLPGAGRNLTMSPKSSLLLPVDFKLSDDLHIVYSTSEILSKRKVGNTEYVFMRGKKGIEGEMVIKTAGEITGASEGVSLEGNAGLNTIRYSHGKVSVFKAGGITFIVIPEDMADKFWISDEMVIITDNYYLEDINRKENALEISFQVNNPGEHYAYLWCGFDPHNLMVDGREVALKKDAVLGAYVFRCEYKDILTPEIKWISNWKYCPDSAEAGEKFDDSGWNKIDSKTALEKGGYLGHGYYWYRNYFTVDAGASEVKLSVKTNEMDRLLVYINGSFRWVGIGSPVLDISKYAKKGKNTLAILYANEFHTKAHPHEGPIQKVSGLYYPVKVYGKAEGKKFEHEFKDWKLKFGLGGNDRKYFSAQADESAWIDAPAAEKYVVQEDAGNLIWFRRRFSLNIDKEHTAPVFVEVKSLSNRCLIYVNGFLLGKYESVGPQNRFFIPDSLLKKENEMVILLEGPGFHPVKQSGFLPAEFEDLKLGFYYTSKKSKTVLSR